MGKFNLEDYETVQQRIPRFLEKTEYRGRIITHMMSPLECIDTVVFKAEVFDGETLLATGWAMEREGDGYVNKTSHVENCETSAIGRALANMGIHGDKRPSREEMQKVERVEAEQAEGKPRPFIQRIMDACKEANIPKEQFLPWLAKQYQITKMSEIKADMEPAIIGAIKGGEFDLPF